METNTVLELVMGFAIIVVVTGYIAWCYDPDADGGEDEEDFP